MKILGIVVRNHIFQVNHYGVQVVELKKYGKEFYWGAIDEHDIKILLEKNRWTPNCSKARAIEEAKIIAKEYSYYFLGYKPFLIGENAKKIKKEEDTPPGIFNFPFEEKDLEQGLNP